MTPERKGAYIRPSKRPVMPGVIFGVEVLAQQPTQPLNPTWLVQSWYGARVCVIYRRRDRWTAPQSAYVSTPDALREWMTARRLRRRINWVIAPVASEALTLSGWWEYVERTNSRGSTAVGDGVDGPLAEYSDESIRITQLCLTPRTDIIGYTHLGARWRWVSARNYWPDGRPARPVDRPIGGVDNQRSAGWHSSTDGQTGGEAVALAGALRDLSVWYTTVASAPLGCTAGQLAWGVLRSHCRPRAVCTHSDEDCHRLERSSAHGGRATAWFLGRVTQRALHSDGRSGLCVGNSVAEIPGPVYQVDVRSMYPSLLRSERYPTKLRGYECGAKPGDIADLCQSWGVIARVRVETETPEFPCRRDRLTRYPVGRFTTTLAGPDLLALSRVGKIIKVYEMALYNLGRPFAESMDVLLSERESARQRGDDDAQTFAKLLANSIAGKLAQRQGGWSRCSLMDGHQQWGEHRVINSQTGAVARYRYVAGSCWRWNDDKTGRGPHTAAFAYLTAYGRQHMATLRASMPALSVVSQDTDGLWCTGAGIHALTVSGKLAHEAPGELRLVGSADMGQWFGARHYVVDGRWTLAGFRNAVISHPGPMIRYSQSTPLFGTRYDSAPSQVVVATHCVPLPGDLIDGTVGEDGWVRPYRYLSRWREDDDRSDPPESSR